MGFSTSLFIIFTLTSNEKYTRYGIILENEFSQAIIIIIINTPSNLKSSQNFPNDVDIMYVSRFVKKKNHIYLRRINFCTFFNFKLDDNYINHFETNHCLIVNFG